MLSGRHLLKAILLVTYNPRRYWDNNFHRMFGQPLVLPLKGNRKSRKCRRLKRHTKYSTIDLAEASDYSKFAQVDNMSRYKIAPH